MKFTKEQQDYLKHCGEHFEVLTGGRGHSKTKEVIEDLQKELERYKNTIERIQNMYVFIDQLGEILEELKGSDE